LTGCCRTEPRTSAFLGIGVPDTIISRVALVKSIRVKARLERGKKNEDPLDSPVLTRPFLVSAARQLGIA
jgi:hypothetical protein